MPEAIITQNLVTLPITSQELGRGPFCPLTKIGLSNIPITMGLKMEAPMTNQTIVLSLCSQQTCFKCRQKNSFNDSINIKIGNQCVKQAKYAKFLGLLLDENLSRKYHLSEISKKLSRTCVIFFKVRHLLPTNVLA